ncbi:MAG TPA: phosphoglycerate mutase, partial [Syntrophomonadaceae bacterium]|nr:phosphoglycerate mutase [Syntrophomonadaceae bacterium]
IESPDEAGHQGNLATKIWSIEQIDREVLGPLMEELNKFDHIRVLVMPDHPTPLRIRTHSAEPVPYMLYDSNRPCPTGPKAYDELSAARGLFIAEGHLLMKYFIQG